MGILTSPGLSAAVLEFSLVNERVASMRLHVAGRKSLDCCLCLCTEWQFGVPGLLESLGGVLEGVPHGDFNTHV